MLPPMVVSKLSLFFALPIDNVLDSTSRSLKPLQFPQYQSWKELYPKMVHFCCQFSIIFICSHEWPVLNYELADESLPMMNLLVPFVWALNKLTCWNLRLNNVVWNSETKHVFQLFSKKNRKSICFNFDPPTVLIDTRLPSSLPSNYCWTWLFKFKYLIFCESY